MTFLLHVLRWLVILTAPPPPPGTPHTLPLYGYIKGNCKFIGVNRSQETELKSFIAPKTFYYRNPPTHVQSLRKGKISENLILLPKYFFFHSEKLTKQFMTVYTNNRLILILQRTVIYFSNDFFKVSTKFHLETNRMVFNELFQYENVLKLEINNLKKIDLNPKRLFKGF